MLREKTLVLILDYEGTLVPAGALAVRLPPAKRKQLTRLSQLGRVKLAVIDRRPAAALKKLVGVPGAVYLGHQGLETEGAGFDLVHPEASETKALMSRLRDRLKQAFKGGRGAAVPQEDFSLNVSWAQMAAKRAESFRSAVEKVLRPYLRSSRLMVSENKDGFQIRPVLRWSKGTTVLWLYGKILAQTAEEKILPVYMGGGRTDEDVFRSLKPVGVSVKVACETKEMVSSDADYYLLSHGEVFQAIGRLLELKSAPAHSPSAKVAAVAS